MNVTVMDNTSQLYLIFDIEYWIFGINYIPEIDPIHQNCQYVDVKFVSVTILWVYTLACVLGHLDDLQ